MQNPELCRELLQRILPDLEIDRIGYPELQKSIEPDMDARSVRLDVYVKDETCSEKGGISIRLKTSAKRTTAFLWGTRQ